MLLSPFSDGLSRPGDGPARVSCYLVRYYFPARGWKFK